MSAAVIYQNRVMRRFHDAGAVGPDRAKTLTEIGQRRSLVFRYLCARGVIAQAGPDSYYLAPAQESLFRKRRLRRAVTVLLVVFFVAMVVWACGNL